MSNPNQPRHGKRAKGIVTVTIPMSQALADELKELARLDNRAFAPWARIHLGNVARRSRAARKVAA